MPNNLIVTANLIEELESLEEVAFVIAFKIAEISEIKQTNEAISNKFSGFVNRIIDINAESLNNKYLEDLNLIFDDLKQSKNPILVFIKFYIIPTITTLLVYLFESFL